MKRIFFALTIASLGISLAVGQKKPALKHVTVTARDVAPKKDYVVNLTRGGTLYDLSADVDSSRVQIRSALGSVSMAELIKQSGQDLHGKAVVGLTSDIRAANIGSRRPGGGLNFNCGDLVCTCNGDADCNHMFTTNSCGPVAICVVSGGSVVCICAAASH